MKNVTNTITEEDMTALANAGALYDPVVTHGPGGVGWTLHVRFAGGRSYCQLRSRRGSVRVFGSLDALHRFCVALGLRVLVVKD